MIVKISVPGKLRLKLASSFYSMFVNREGEVHYIGGADVLPAPFDAREEAEVLGQLGTEKERPLGEIFNAQQRPGVALCQLVL